MKTPQVGIEIEPTVKKHPHNNNNCKMNISRLFTCCGSTKKLNMSDPSLEKACIMLYIE